MASYEDSPRKTLKFLLNQIYQFENPNLVILMTHMLRKKSLPFLDIEGVDILINGHIEKATDEIDTNPVRKNGKIFLQAGTRGQKVGEVLVSLYLDGTKDYQHQMVPLDSNIPSDLEMTQLYDDYNRKIEEIFFQTLANRKNKSKKQVYATEVACKRCHMEAHKIWSQSRHAKAYTTLKKTIKHSTQNVYLVIP